MTLTILELKSSLNELQAVFSRPSTNNDTPERSGPRKVINQTCHQYYLYPKSVTDINVTVCYDWYEDGPVNRLCNIVQFETDHYYLYQKSVTDIDVTVCYDWYEDGPVHRLCNIVQFKILRCES